MAGVDLRRSPYQGSGSQYAPMDADALNAPLRALGGAGRQLQQTGGVIGQIKVQKDREQALMEQERDKNLAALEAERQKNYDLATSGYFLNQLRIAEKSQADFIKNNPGDTESWFENSRKVYSEIYEQFGKSSENLSEDESIRLDNEIRGSRGLTNVATRSAAVAYENQRRNEEWTLAAVDYAAGGDMEGFEMAFQYIDTPPGKEEAVKREIWGRGKYNAFAERIRSEGTTEDDLDLIKEELSDLDDFTNKSLGEESRRALVSEINAKKTALQDSFNRGFSEIFKKVLRAEPIAIEETDQMYVDKKLDPNSREIVETIRRASVNLAAEKRLYQDEKDDERLEDWKDKWAVKAMGWSKSLLGSKISFDPDKNAALSKEDREELWEEIDSMPFGDLTKGNMFAYAMRAEIAALKEPDDFGVLWRKETDGIETKEERKARAYLAERLRVVYLDENISGKGIGAQYEKDVSKIDSMFPDEETRFEDKRKEIDALVDAHISRSYENTLRREILNRASTDSQESQEVIEVQW